MARLLLLTPAELTRDPRARREVAAARRRGFEVVGLCGRISGEPPVPLDGVAVSRVGPSGRVDPSWESGRGRREPAWRRELRGVVRLARLAARTVRLRRAGRRLGRFDVVHANDLDTLPAARLLARGARLVYDAHELYADFEPDPPRLYRRVALRLERSLARRADAVVTVSEPLADELIERLGLARRPVVVLNAPELASEEPPATAPQGPLRAVYQGAFGTGRPLDDLLEAIAAAPSVLLRIRVVRVAPADLHAEVERCGLADRVEIADPLPPDRLVDGLRGSEVGLVFDRPVTRNGELSLPNKLFEYLMAGLAVVAPRLPGLAPLVEDEAVGLTYEPPEPAALAEALEGLAADRSRLATLRANARRAAVERYNAEAQAQALAAAWGLDR